MPTIDKTAGFTNQKFEQNMHALAGRGDGSLKGIFFSPQTVDPGNLADGAGETISLTVAGAELRDPVLLGPGVDVSGMTITANVVAADTVEIRVQNESGGTLNLGSSTWNIMVFDLT